MAGSHYGEFIEEAFIGPIRSVLIVDDDFPTYGEILTAANRAGVGGVGSGNKAWRANPDRFLHVVEAFRRRSRPLLVDIHDGTNVSTQEEENKAAELNQSDLLVLDYELEKDRPSDGTRAIEILRRLMSSSHFNLVVIYTKEDLYVVFDEIRWGLIAPSGIPLADDEVESANELIDSGEDLRQGFRTSLSDTIGAAQYFHSRINQSSYLRTMAKGQEPYTQFKGQADLVEWTRNERRVVLRYFLHELEQRSVANSDSKRRFNDLEWSSNGPKWIKSGSAFVGLSSKTGGEDDLLGDLREALIDWNPPPSRLFLTKLRAEIDEYGVLAQAPALSFNHALAYWYYRLLRGDSVDERRWDIAESISRHSDQLLACIRPGIEQFASRLIEAEIGAGDPVEMCKDHFGVDFNKDEDKTKAALEHNAFVCSREPSGSHLTLGHMFAMSNEYWVCLSPACDMVPSQMPSWRTETFGERLPFVAIRLRSIKLNKVPKDIHSNRFVFFGIDGEVKGYCFNEPSAESSGPEWHIFFAEKRGRFAGNDFQFTVAHICSGKSRLVATRSKARVVAQLRYEYALNLTQKLGVSLTRIGLDFTDRMGPCL